METAVKANRPNVISVLVGNKSEFRSNIPGTFEATRAEVAEVDFIIELDSIYYTAVSMNWVDNSGRCTRRCSNLGGEIF